MNTSLWFSEYKLHHRPFNTASCVIYSESLDDMPLILILLLNNPSNPTPANFCLSLNGFSTLQMNLPETAIKIYSGKSRWLLNDDDN